MKRLLRFAVLAALLCLAPIAYAQVGPVQPAEDFQQTLSHATLSVYQGKWGCDYESFDTFFGPVKVWTCSFKRRFTCTATVVLDDGSGTYTGLSAGHCIDWAEEKNYYVGTTIDKEPVLHNIRILKAENDDRYDYVLFQFRSAKKLPTVKIDLEGGVPALGTKVININFAMGVGKHFSHGEVTSEALDEDTFGSKQRFMASVEGAPGASGSAVVDVETHKIIGLCEFGFGRGNLGMGVIPTGQRLVDFMDDDSAGLKPLPEPETPPAKGQESLLSKFLAVVHKVFLYSTGI